MIVEVLLDEIKVSLGLGSVVDINSNTVNRLRSPVYLGLTEHVPLLQLVHRLPLGVLHDPQLLLPEHLVELLNKQRPLICHALLVHLSKRLRDEPL